MGLEIRFDIPLLSVFIRKKQTELKVFSFGSESFMNIKVYNIGGSIESVVRLFYNKHYISIFGFSPKLTKFFINKDIGSTIWRCIDTNVNIFSISFIDQYSSSVNRALVNLHSGAAQFLKKRNDWMVKAGPLYFFSREGGQRDLTGLKLTDGVSVFFGHDNDQNPEGGQPVYDYKIYQPSIFYNRDKDYLFDVEGCARLLSEGLWSAENEKFFRLEKNFFNVIEPRPKCRTKDLQSLQLRAFYSYYRDINIMLNVVRGNGIYRLSFGHFYLVKFNPNLYVDEIYCSNSITRASYHLTHAQAIFVKENPNYQYVCK
jgi:hypothetical protein